jgi:predicted O-methyltransferase YrrM
MTSPLVDYSPDVRPGRFEVIYTTPAHMTAAERVMLYAMVFSLRPERCLEIGTYLGGSALIIGAAMDDLGAGRLFCVDPNPQVAPDHWKQIEHRAAMIAKPSPQALFEAMRLAGGKFDFAFIDGDHETPGVIQDIEAALEVLTPDAYVLLHDAHYRGVADAIDRMIVEHADRLLDCGMVSVEQTETGTFEDGRHVIWGGLRLLRCHQSKAAEASRRCG